MSDIVTVAVVVGITGIIGPLVLAIVANRSRKQDRQEDWARQDEVAARVTEAARKTGEVADQAATAAKLLARENQKVAAATLLTNDKIDAVAVQATQIHGLVNSAMSEEMRRNLESQESLLVVLEELQDVKRVAGVPTSADAAARIEATRATIAELKAALGDRFRATMRAEETAAAAAAAAAAVEGEAT
jgi:hypothetical protein